MAWSMGTTNAWADRVDGEEEEAPAPPPAAFGAEESFPSLGEAAKVPPPTKKDKKKGGKPKPMSLADFNTGAYKAPVPAGGGGAYRAGAGYGRPKPSDDEILNMLPKGPSGYSQEDTSGGLGGAFKEYGGNRGGGFGDRERNNDREERPRRGFGDRDRDEEGRGGEREEQGPSRADEDADWGASRKFVPSEPRRGGGGGFDGDRRPGGFDREREPREREEDMGPSRADESSNWGRDRKPLPAPEGGRDGGRGFSDRYGDDRAPAREPQGPSRADTEDSWGRKAPLPQDDRRAPMGQGQGQGGSMGASRADEEDRWSRRGPAPEAAPAPAPAGDRPRLKLAPRTKPIENPPPPKPEPTEAKPAEDVKPSEPRAPKANPFGAARPREEILKEQGKDPVKEELKLEANIPRDDTPEEIALKKELEELKAKVEGAEDAEEVKKSVSDKELEIEKLRLEINDKLRFARKASKDKENSKKEGEPKKAAEDPKKEEA